ncbi:ankyrin repeat domain-containing protein [Candidatus Babeliales bacterium]|nr:ankyrin repeat domain-containing protein [Candidatus Babeliales bacterium]
MALAMIVNVAFAALHNDALINQELQAAAIAGDLAGTRHCIEAGADIQTTTIQGLYRHMVHKRRGWTPLHWAAKGGHAHVIRELVVRGANVFARDSVGNMPVHIVVSVPCFEHNEKRFIECLQELNYVTKNKNNRHREVFVQNKIRGLVINSQGTDNVTPLHLVAADGKVGMMRYLLQEGAGVHAYDSNGWTPLHSAAMALKKGKEIIELLLAHGADKTKQSYTGSTPAQIAIKAGASDLVPLLVRSSVRVAEQVAKRQRSR